MPQAFNTEWNVKCKLIDDSLVVALEMVEVLFY